MVSAYNFNELFTSTECIRSTPAEFCAYLSICLEFVFDISSTKTIRTSAKSYSLRIHASVCTHALLSGLVVSTIYSAIRP